MDIDGSWRRHRQRGVGLGTTLRLPAGTLLTVEGAPGSEFFVIESGRVVVRRHAHDVAELGPGDHFGEIALIDPHAMRTATVIALEEVRVRVYDRREFAALLRRDPVLANQILRHAVERLLAA